MQERDEKQDAEVVDRVVQALDAFHKEIASVRDDHKRLMADIRKRIDAKKLDEIYKTFTT